MSLDLIKVVSQLEGMAAKLKANTEQKHQHLQQALNIISNEAINLDLLKKKIAASSGKTTWLVADLVDGLARYYEPPPVIPEFTIITF